MDRDEFAEIDDLDIGFKSNIDEKSSRLHGDEDTPIRNIANEFIGGAIEEVTDNKVGTIKRAVDKVFTSFGGEEAAVTKDIYNHIVDEVSIAKNEIGAAAAPTLRHYSNKFGEETMGRRVIDSISEFFGVHDNDGSTSEEADPALELVNDLFKTTTNRSIPKSMNSVNKGTAINTAITSLAVDSIDKFHRQYTLTFYKKSLELQYRLLLLTGLQKDMLDRKLENITTALVAISTNTSLPEYAKLRTFTAIRANVRNKAIESITSSFFNISDTMEQFKNSIRLKFRNIINMFKSGISIERDSRELSSMGEELGISSYNLGGSTLVGEAIEGVSDHIGEKLSKTRGGKRIKDYIGNVASDPYGYLKDVHSESTGVKRFISGAAANIIRPTYAGFADRTHIDVDDAGTVALYTNRTDNAITDLIPSYLSSIDATVRSIYLSMTQDPDNLNMVRDVDSEISLNQRYYDYDSKRLKSGVEVKDDIERLFNVELEKRGAISQVDRLVKALNSTEGMKEREKITGKEAADISGELYDFIKDSNNIDAISGSNTYNQLDEFYGALSPKLAKKLKKRMRNYVGDVGDGGLGEKRNHIRSIIKMFTKSIPDPMDIIEDLVNKGNIRHLIDLGILKFDSDYGTYALDKEVYSDIIRRQLRTVDKYVDSGESAIDRHEKLNRDISAGEMHSFTDGSLTDTAIGRVINKTNVVKKSAVSEDTTQGVEETNTTGLKKKKNNPIKDFIKGSTANYADVTLPKNLSLSNMPFGLESITDVFRTTGVLALTIPDFFKKLKKTHSVIQKEIKRDKEVPEVKEKPFYSKFISKVKKYKKKVNKKINKYVDYIEDKKADADHAAGKLMDKYITPHVGLTRKIAKKVLNKKEVLTDKYREGRDYLGRAIYPKLLRGSRTVDDIYDKGSTIGGELYHKYYGLGDRHISPLVLRGKALTTDIVNKTKKDIQNTKGHIVDGISNVNRRIKNISIRGLTGGAGNYKKNLPIVSESGYGNSGSTAFSGTPIHRVNDEVVISIDASDPIAEETLGVMSGVHTDTSSLEKNVSDIRGFLFKMYKLTGFFKGKSKPDEDNEVIGGKTNLINRLFIKTHKPAELKLNKHGLPVKDNNIEDTSLIGHLIGKENYELVSIKFGKLKDQIKTFLSVETVKGLLEGKETKDKDAGDVKGKATSTIVKDILNSPVFAGVVAALMTKRVLGDKSTLDPLNSKQKRRADTIEAVSLSKNGWVSHHLSSLKDKKTLLEDRINKEEAKKFPNEATITSSRMELEEIEDNIAIENKRVLGIKKSNKTSTLRNIFKQKRGVRTGFTEKYKDAYSGEISLTDEELKAEKKKAETELKKAREYFALYSDKNKIKPKIDKINKVIDAYKMELKRPDLTAEKKEDATLKIKEQEDKKKDLTDIKKASTLEDYGILHEKIFKSDINSMKNKLKKINDAEALQKEDKKLSLAIELGDEATVDEKIRTVKIGIKGYASRIVKIDKLTATHRRELTATKGAKRKEELNVKIKGLNAQRVDLVKLKEAKDEELTLLNDVKRDLVPILTMSKVKEAESEYIQSHGNTIKDKTFIGRQLVKFNVNRHREGTRKKLEKIYLENEKKRHEKNLEISTLQAEINTGTLTPAATAAATARIARLTTEVSAIPDVFNEIDSSTTRQRTSVFRRLFLGGQSSKKEFGDSFGNTDVLVKTHEGVVDIERLSGDSPLRTTNHAITSALTKWPSDRDIPTNTADINKQLIVLREIKANSASMLASRSTELRLPITNGHRKQVLREEIKYIKDIDGLIRRYEAGLERTTRTTENVAAKLTGVNTATTEHDVDTALAPTTTSIDNSNTSAVRLSWNNMQDFFKRTLRGMGENPRVGFNLLMGDFRRTRIVDGERKNFIERLGIMSLGLLGNIASRLNRGNEEDGDNKSFLLKAGNMIKNAISGLGDILKGSVTMLGRLITGGIGAIGSLGPIGTRVGLAATLALPILYYGRSIAEGIGDGVSWAWNGIVGDDEDAPVTTEQAPMIVPSQGPNSETEGQTSPTVSTPYTYTARVQENMNKLLTSDEEPVKKPESVKKDNPAPINVDAVKPQPTVSKDVVSEAPINSEHATKTIVTPAMTTAERWANINALHGKIDTTTVDKTVPDENTTGDDITARAINIVSGVVPSKTDTFAAVDQVIDVKKILLDIQATMEALQSKINTAIMDKNTTNSVPGAIGPVAIDTQSAEDRTHSHADNILKAVELKPIGDRDIFRLLSADTAYKTPWPNMTDIFKSKSETASPLFVQKEVSPVKTIDDDNNRTIDPIRTMAEPIPSIDKSSSINGSVGNINTIQEGANPYIAYNIRDSVINILNKGKGVNLTASNNDSVLIGADDATDMDKNVFADSNGTTSATGQTISRLPFKSKPVTAPIVKKEGILGLVGKHMDDAFTASENNNLINVTEVREVLKLLPIAVSPSTDRRIVSATLINTAILSRVRKIHPNINLTRIKLRTLDSNVHFNLREANTLGNITPILGELFKTTILVIYSIGTANIKKMLKMRDTTKPGDIFEKVAKVILIGMLSSYYSQTGDINDEGVLKLATAEYTGEILKIASDLFGKKVKETQNIESGVAYREPNVKVDGNGTNRRGDTPNGSGGYQHPNQEEPINESEDIYDGALAAGGILGLGLYAARNIIRRPIRGGGIRGRLIGAGVAAAGLAGTAVADEQPMGYTPTEFKHKPNTPAENDRSYGDMLVDAVEYVYDGVVGITSWLYDAAMDVLNTGISHLGSELKAEEVLDYMVGTITGLFAVKKFKGIVRAAGGWSVIGQGIKDTIKGSSVFMKGLMILGVGDAIVRISEGDLIGGGLVLVGETLMLVPILPIKLLGGGLIGLSMVRDYLNEGKDLNKLTENSDPRGIAKLDQEYTPKLSGLSGMMEKTAVDAMTFIASAYNTISPKTESPKVGVESEDRFKAPLIPHTRSDTPVTLDTNALGALSHKFEAKDTGTVSTGRDRGNISYGSWQITSAKNKHGRSNIEDFLSTSKYGKEFDGLKINSSEFIAKWKEIAKREPEAFRADQHAWIKRTLYTPLLNKVKKQYGIDLNSENRAIQEALWSASVQHGGAFLIFKDTMNAGANIKDVPEFLTAFYGARNKYAQKAGTDDAVRYKKELAAAISIYKDGGARQPIEQVKTSEQAETLGQAEASDQAKTLKSGGMSVIRNTENNETGLAGIGGTTGASTPSSSIVNSNIQVVDDVAPTYGRGVSKTTTTSSVGTVNNPITPTDKNASKTVELLATATEHLGNISKKEDRGTNIENELKNISSIMGKLLSVMEKQVTLPQAYTEKNNSKQPHYRDAAGRVIDNNSRV